MSCVLVDLYTAAGEVEGALRLLEPMLDESADMTGAELHRLEGALLLRRAAPDASAAACSAISTAGSPRASILAT